GQHHRETREMTEHPEVKGELWKLVPVKSCYWKRPHHTSGHHNLSYNRDDSDGSTCSDDVTSKSYDINAERADIDKRKLDKNGINVVIEPESLPPYAYHRNNSNSKRENERKHIKRVKKC
ncbi:unnamed protein product, partial [Owenia fusiformis]